MNFSDLERYFVITVVIACLCTGYVVKKWLKDVDNKYIPTICFFEGAILNCFVSGLSIESVVFGSLMGLASTGFYEAFRQYIEKK